MHDAALAYYDQAGGEKPDDPIECRDAQQVLRTRWPLDSFVWVMFALQG